MRLVLKICWPSPIRMERGCIRWLRRKNEYAKARVRAKVEHQLG